MNEADIVYQALTSLQALTGIEVAMQPVSGEADYCIELQVQESTHRFVAVVKRHIQQRMVGLVIHQLTGASQQSDHRLLITDRVSPSVGELLREQGMCYLDTAGNCYLTAGDLLVLIQGQRLRRSPGATRPIRAFNKAGLKLIFTLLQRPDRVNETYRTLATLAGVSLGAMEYIITDLEQLGYVVTVVQGRRRLKNVNDLLDKWVAGYVETLRPRLIRGTFRPLDQNWNQRWKQVELDPTRTVWGGEPAADLVTGYLKPQRFTLYTRDDLSTLMQQVRMVPDPTGSIEVLEMFWTPDHFQQEGPESQQPVAPVLIMYADLIASAHTRAIETARLLYDAHLQDFQ